MYTIYIQYIQVYYTDFELDRKKNNKMYMNNMKYVKFEVACNGIPRTVENRNINVNYDT